MKARLLLPFILFALIIHSSKLFASVIGNPNTTQPPFEKQIYYYVDNQKKIQRPTQIPDSLFQKANDKKVLNFQFTKDPHWIKIVIKTQPNNPNLFLRITNPNLDKIQLFYKDTTTQQFVSSEYGDQLPFYSREVDNEEFILPLPSNNTSLNTFYLKVVSSGQMLLPIYIEDKAKLNASISLKLILSGIYIGVMLAIGIYNLLIYMVIRDKSYLIYVLFIITTLLIQSDSMGICFKYLWPNHPEFNKPAHIFFPALIGIVSLAFFYQFLNIKKHNPRILTYIQIFTVLYIAVFIFSFSNYYNATYLTLQLLACIVSIFILYFSIKLALEGDKAAFYFIIAFGFFLICVIIFVLRNFNIIPFNAFTIYILQIGSVFEVMLLSFALADKINLYRKEKEELQLETLRISQENAELIFRQNIILEEKVKERTTQLQELNDELEDTLHSLKNTQSQLVDSEKMASLGQLTAGIAHEINNPINFVTSNVKPLELDIEDLNYVLEQYEGIENASEFEIAKTKIENIKKEIDVNFLKTEIKTLLSGIKEGATRTAEIVKSLKTFSRLDEFDMKPVNLNEGIESTLVLIRNTMPKELILIKELGTIPKVECLGGKLNQVFMNLITNAIQAVKMKKNLSEKEYLSVKTYFENDQVFISIKDTGVGIPEEIKKKIFEPFFSTKDVGEGTGLGLAIVKSIIESHNGHIRLTSELGKGSEFIINLPVKN